MLPVHSQGRAGHRRSSFESTGAFTSLGALPQRTIKKSTLHFDEDDASFNAVPFPCTSPLHSPSFTKTPAVLKPLKSSLKSNSSPNIPFPSQSLVPSIMFPDLHHQRASSAPCMPLLVSPFPPSTSSSSTSSSSSHQHVPKNVHFPSQEGGLATVLVFKKSARPASLSRLGEETETDTDGDASSTGYGDGGWPGWSGKYVGGSTFPFPRVPANVEKKSPLNPSKQKKIQYNIDWSASSVIPRKNVDRKHENIFFESLQVVDGVDETALQGTLLVRNITYQKTVMVRYTMDEWVTMNDVLGWYDGNGEGLDRFRFSIPLGNKGLEAMVVWLVAKYAGGAGESGVAVEWWDNNEGKNYRAGFKEVVDQEERLEVYKRGVVVSAPTTYTGPAPTSTPTRPKLSDPQISSSTFTGQSTLARLKNLKLKNYAAPSGYGYEQSFSATKETTVLSSLPKLTPPVLTLTSASPTFVRPSGSSPPPSESPSAPNLTLDTTFGMSSPTLSTASTASTTTSTDSTPVQTPTRGDEDDGDEGWKVGVDEEDSLRWTSLIPGDRDTDFSCTSHKSSPPFSDLKESAEGRGVEGEGKKESAYESTNLTNGGGGMGLMPPQRKRGLQQKRAGGRTSSSSGSDSKNSKPSSSPSTSTPTPVPPSTATSVTLKQRPKPPKLDLPFPTVTPPTSASVTSPSDVQSPYPRRDLGYNSPSQPQRHGHRYQSMTSSESFIGNSKSPSTLGGSDAIYQALVREWCFAQGPSISTSGKTTPVLVKSPGLICASGDGE